MAPPGKAGMASIRCRFVHATGWGVPTPLGGGGALFHLSAERLSRSPSDFAVPFFQNTRIDQGDRRPLLVIFLCQCLSWSQARSRDAPRVTVAQRGRSRLPQPRRMAATQVPLRRAAVSALGEWLGRHQSRGPRLWPGAVTSGARGRHRGGPVGQAARGLGWCHFPPLLRPRPPRHKAAQTRRVALRWGVRRGANTLETGGVRHNRRAVFGTGSKARGTEYC